jgi:hypothetical protein
LRIALFTPFSPEIGGGSVQLRSHLEQLPDLDVEWYYLAGKDASGKHWHRLGERLSTGQILSDLCARTRLLPGSKKMVRRLVEQMPADRYWVVAHNEGISVAAELIEMGKKVHLTVHDDPFGTWTRSERYRLFRPLLGRTFSSILRAAESIDVTSWGMRNLYRQQYGVKCFSLYLHIAALPNLNRSLDPTALTIGHIGTLYHPESFRRFVAACKQVAAEQQRTLRMVRVGTSAQMDEVAAADPDLFVAHGDLSEQDAISVLASCDFVYAMYPAGQRFELFRKTSLPIKLSTYVQAQRPVFAHSPSDSTLARIVGTYNVGCVCESNDESEIAMAIRKISDQIVPHHSYELIRETLMGSAQVQQLGAALRGEDWQHFPESDFRGQ